MKLNFNMRYRIKRVITVDGQLSYRVQTFSITDFLIEMFFFLHVNEIGWQTICYPKDCRNHYNEGQEIIFNSLGDAKDYIELLILSEKRLNRIKKREKKHLISYIKYPD